MPKAHAAINFIDPKATGCWQKKNFPDDKNKIICHASRISNHNLDFIATLDKENAGTWDVNIKSKPNKNGTYDKGICQFNSGYYSHYYKLPEWNNPEWQVNRCFEEFSSAVKRGTIYTKFYAYARREPGKKNFIWVNEK